MKTLRFFLVFGLLSVAQAQSPLEEPAAGTVWLDLRPAGEGSPAQNVPPWVTRLESFSVQRPDGGESTLFIVSLGAEARQAGALQVRLVFDESLEHQPVVTSVDEAGVELAQSEPLGKAGTGLLGAETLTVPSRTTAALHIEVPGDGKNVHTVMISLLKEWTHLRSADADSLAEPMGAFDREMVPAPLTQDGYLFGRVRALLFGESEAISQDNPLLMEVQLEEKPLVAVLRFRVRGGEVDRPLEVTTNNGLARPVSYALPDLADPAYVGIVRPAGWAFRYADWLPAQVVIPGHEWSATHPNQIQIKLPPSHGPLAVRDVTLELKYNWDRLNYDLVP
jgi:hypothetical protein